MAITMIHRSDLVINSKKTAREFLAGVKAPCTIPMVYPHHTGFVIRVEPGNLISVISKQSIAEGSAWMIPNIVDDGSEAYRLRKHINAYLKGDD